MSDVPTSMPSAPTSAGARGPGGRLAECLGELQLHLRDAGLEGWLLYDHRGQNGLAAHALGLDDRGFVRRWFYWIPADGVPALVAHETEREGFGELPGDSLAYHDWRSLRAALEASLPRRGRVAMEHQSIGGHPDLSRVDGGTVELVRSQGLGVVSSDALSNRFLGPLGPHGEAMHALAADALLDAEATVRAFLVDTPRPRESEVRACARRAIAATGLESAAPPLVASGPHTRARLLAPRPDRDRHVEPGDLLLVELLGRVPEPGSPYAQRTLAATIGAPHREVARAFEVAREAREAAIELLADRARGGARTLGFEVDDAARAVVARHARATLPRHRTGHHVGRLPYSAEACTLDGTEFHDVREVLPGLAWHVEPGVYEASFGVRAGATIVRTEGGVRRLDPGQDALVVIEPAR